MPPAQHSTCEKSADPPSALAYPPIERGTAGFEVAAMRRLLDGEHAEIRQRMRALLSRPHFRYYPGTDMEGRREQVLAWAKEIAHEGIGALFMPKTVGGQEDLGKFMAAFETVGFHDLSLAIKMGVQFGLWGGSVQRLGTEYHHRRYLPATAKLDLPGCFAMTEIGHGSNVKDIETIAIYEPMSESFDLHSPTFTAGKNYIGNAARDGRIATVFAQLETGGARHGVHAFVVPIRDDEGHPLPGIRIEDNGEKLGLNGVDNGRIWFDHVRVPRAELLDRFAQVAADGTYTSPVCSQSARFFTMLGTLVSGRISVGAIGNAASKVGLSIAIRYGARRRQFGPAGAAETLLLDYPAHQRRLMPLLANAYALHFVCESLTKLNIALAGSDYRRVETMAAALKSFSTWNMTRTLQECREACGGEGYLAVNRFAALKSDSDVFTTFEGDNTVLMQLAAKNLLSDFKDSLQGKGLAVLATWMLDRKLRGWAARNPFVTWRVGAGHLCNAGWQRALFRFREKRLLYEAGDRLRMAIARGMDAYSAFTAHQNELLRLSFAYVERLVLENFTHAVNQCSEASLRVTLKRLCDLFALVQIEKHAGWHLENRVLSPAKSRAITQMVERLCAEVRKDAVALVDSFGIPDQCLAAPMALE